MLVIWAAVEFCGMNVVAPGLTGMTNGVTVNVLRTDGSSVTASKPWLPLPKLL